MGIQKKAENLNVGDYVRHPKRKDKIMRVDSVDLPDILLRNKDDASDFMFITRDWTVEVVTI